MREYWATFSIYDHREHFYKSSLVLFDSVIIPVPTAPFRSIGHEELQRLSADAHYLEANGCARVFPWDPETFDDWRADYLGAGAASRINATSGPVEEERVSNEAALSQRDARLDTRYQMQYEVQFGHLRPPDAAGQEVVAMPVFGARAGYSNLPSEVLGADASRQATVDLIIDRLPVPDADTPFERIVELRQEGQIGPAVRKLRQWQLGLMSKLSTVEDDRAAWDARLEEAEIELATAVDDYKQAMANLHSASRSAWFTTLFSVPKNPLAAIGRLFTEHRDTFTLSSKHEQSWKFLYDKPFAFAGAIVAASDIVRP